MSILTPPVPGYTLDVIPDLSDAATREHLSPAAIRGFFQIMDRWNATMEQAGLLLGGIPKTTLYKMKASTGPLRVDELTRISYIVGIYAALHAILPKPDCDQWITERNSNPLFRGVSPLEFATRGGIPALAELRGYLDAIRAGN